MERRMAVAVGQNGVKSRSFIRRLIISPASANNTRMAALSVDLLAKKLIGV